MKALLAGLVMLVLTLSPVTAADDAMTPGPVVGIGVEVREVDQHPMIAQVVPNQPAAKHGIKAGDRILKIDGKDVTDLDLKHVASLLRGAEKSRVSVTIQRPGESSPRTFSLRRQIVTLVVPDPDNSP